MIKAIIFDVGGVLVRTIDHQHRRYWENRLNLEAGESERIVFDSEMGRAAQAGEVSDEDLWLWIFERLGFEPEEGASFRRSFWAGDAVDRELVNYIRSLRPKYMTAIISNATDALRQTLDETYEIADAFDVIVGSAEEKTMKPDEIIYLTTLGRLGCMPQEAVFIDDSVVNVEAARKVGIHALHYREGLDVPAALAELGIGPDRSLEE